MGQLGLRVSSFLLAATMNIGAHAAELMPIDYRNTPGLSCRAVTLALVYVQPNKSSRYLGRTQNFIAVTGPQVDGFFPIITGRGIRGWVNSTDVLGAYGRGHVDRCWVQQARDGRLLFGWSQPGRG